MNDDEDWLVDGDGYWLIMIMTMVKMMTLFIIYDNQDEWLMSDGGDD